MPVPDPPPAYTPTPALGTLPETGSDLDALPGYTFPSKFSVGGKLTDGPLVDIRSIKGHLALLSAFAELKEQVEGKAFDIPYVPEDKEAKWAWFVGMAAERFDRWCLSLSPSASLQPAENIFPPLDVMMVWHSYMLNPRWYAEDGQRLLACKPLLALGEVFGRELHRLPSLLNTPPSEARITTFSQRVLLPYDPFESARVNLKKKIKCPRCGVDIVVSCTNAQGTGYLQAGFNAPCPRTDCINVTKESLCARKLAETLSREGEGLECLLPGTLFTGSSTATQQTSHGIVAHIQAQYILTLQTRCVSGINEELCRKILRDTNFSMPELRAKLPKDKLIGRILSAHASPMMYSVDLVGAVLRQGSFITKMVGLGWTKPRCFDGYEGELVLRHALARYHAFLDLLSSAPASFFVPTLDIDLVWHTHQLWSPKYEQDCRTHVGRFIDHDDKADGIKLSSGFDLTSRAWKERFGVRYTYCGCPLPGDTIGQRLSRFVSSATSKSPKLSKEPGLPSDLVPPPNRSRSRCSHARKRTQQHSVRCQERYFV
ncbi:hypothetical protein FA13DRAFT_285160 [Coprinellus micaceus]|uniref:Uncharacterized protein n=1 Tax=Coprinellus micaceus TaxID=71717 RepID=A0A4Y7TDV3_COPMI|nr:hypothetical protein FA13DRAFT_285160 [Coprinellus micaceus]